MQAHAKAREGVRTALLPVDDANRRATFEASLAKGSDGIGRRTGRCDDVLDQNHPFSGHECALELVRGSVVLRLTAHDQERLSGLQATLRRRA